MTRKPKQSRVVKAHPSQVPEVVEDPRKRLAAFYDAIADHDLKLCIAAMEGDTEFALAALDKGADVNAVHGDTGMRAIHLAASGGNGVIVEALLGSGECDLTIRDTHGRLASDCAAYAAKDYVLADRLAAAEAQQFKATGKDPRIRAMSNER